MSSVWGPKALENIVDFELSFDVEPEKSMLRRRALAAADHGDDTDARSVLLSPDICAGTRGDLEL